MSIQTPPPSAPPAQFPIQQNNGGGQGPAQRPITVSQPSPGNGRAADLLPIANGSQDVSNTTNNSQVDSSNIENSQVNVQQNFNSGNFQEEWIMPHFTVRPRHEVSVAVTTDFSGNNYVTAQWTHRFRAPKIAKQARKARLQQYYQQIAFEHEAHCAKLYNIQVTSKSCQGVLVSSAPVQQVQQVQQVHHHAPAPVQAPVQRGLW